VAIHLAQWLSPAFAVKVTKWVARYIAGDITLVPEVVARHDAVYDTTSQVLVNTAENEAIEAARRAAALKDENDQLERGVHLRMLELDMKGKELSFVKREAEQTM
jgi:hypothetical protein